MLRIRSRHLMAATLLAFGALSAATSTFAGGDWNDSGVAWKSYEAGLAEAKSSNKPVCLVFYTDWCPHCTNYAKIFHDPAVVESSRKLVMVRINKDSDTATSGKFAPDGEYIPRTFFLKPDGTLLPDVTAGREKYKYFFSESDPSSVKGAMEKVAAMTF